MKRATDVPQSTRKKRRFRQAAVVGSLLAFFATSGARLAQADLVAFTVTGTITAPLPGSAPPPYDTVGLGDAFTFSFLLDTATPGSLGDYGSGSLIFDGAIQSASLNVGSASTLFGSGQAQTANDVLGLAPGAADLMSTRVASEFDGIETVVEMTLIDSSASAFGSTDLPSALDVGAWDSREFRISFVETEDSVTLAEIVGQINTITPNNVIPAPAALLLGVLGLSLTSRRRRQIHPR